MKHFQYIFLAIVLFLLTSCFGIRADIVLNQNGSGTISLEYRISKALDSLGRLDGNERWNTIPVGRADFERTISRLPDMRLLSFSSSEDPTDLIISLRMEFGSMEGLLAFLDATGQSSSFRGNSVQGTLNLTLSEGREGSNPDLDSLFAQITQGYSVSFGLTVPGNANLSILNRSGGTLPANTYGINEYINQGRRVYASFTLYDIITSTNGIVLNFNWN